MTTGYTQVNAIMNIKYTAQLALTPQLYYGFDVNGANTWRGGEIVFNSGDSRLYIQTATTGQTPTWRRLATQFIAYP
jgi:hypothetical protein